ncbi:MAG: metallophosphoesterase, partial [Bacteroidaceae bacterium]|nr:metallophosphoesterase [Bacteroidaceae bacterium]
MKKHILLLLFAALCMPLLKAQNYVVSSLATPGAATFTSDKIQDGVITLPFAAGTHAIPVETNQNATVSCDDDWCEASFADSTLTLTVTENSTEDARTTILKVRSKDFHPLLITVKQESRLVFAVISDVHVGNNSGKGYKVKIPQALQNLTGYGKLDAMAVVGDLTDNGRTDQYQEFVQFFGSNSNIINPVENFIFMMGNHDNYDSNGQNNYKSGLRSFNGNRSYPLDQYILIKGYPFISISQRGSANNDDNVSNGTTSYPSTVVTTLKRYLKRAAEEAPGKPIFVFTHVAPRWTCYSSWGEIEGAAWAMKVLNPVLNEYPQVVAFCGHSHYPLGDPRSIHQGANPNSTRNNYYTVIN